MRRHHRAVTIVTTDLPMLCLLPWQNEIPMMSYLISIRRHICFIYDANGIGVWQTVPVMLRPFLMTSQTESLSTETPGFLKRIITLKSLILCLESIYLPSHNKRIAFSSS